MANKLFPNPSKKNPTYIIVGEIANDNISHPVIDEKGIIRINFFRPNTSPMYPKKILPIICPTNTTLTE